MSSLSSYIFFCASCLARRFASNNAVYSRDYIYKAHLAASMRQQQTPLEIMVYREQCAHTQCCRSVYDPEFAVISKGARFMRLLLCAAPLLLAVAQRHIGYAADQKVRESPLSYSFGTTIYDYTRAQKPRFICNGSCYIRGRSVRTAI